MKTSQKPYATVLTKFPVIEPEANTCSIPLSKLVIEALPPVTPVEENKLFALCCKAVNASVVAPVPLEPDDDPLTSLIKVCKAALNFPPP